MKKDTINILNDFSLSLSENIKNIIDEQSKKCNYVFSELNNKFDLGLDMSKIRIKYKPNDKQIQIDYLDTNIINIANKARHEKLNMFNYINIAYYYMPDNSFIEDKNKYNKMMTLHNVVNKILTLFNQQNEYFNDEFLFLEQVNNELESKLTATQIIDYFKHGLRQYSTLQKVDSILDKGEYFINNGVWINGFTNKSIFINKIKFIKNITNTYSLNLIYNDEVVSSSTRVSESTLIEYINKCIYE
jgi:hypothetical protein